MPAALALLLCCLTVATGIAPRAAAHLKIFSMYGDDPAGQHGIVNVRLNVAPYTSSGACAECRGVIRFRGLACWYWGEVRRLYGKSL